MKAIVSCSPDISVMIIPVKKYLLKERGEESDCLGGFVLLPWHHSTPRSRREAPLQGEKLTADWPEVLAAWRCRRLYFKLAGGWMRPDISIRSSFHPQVHLQVPSFPLLQSVPVFLQPRLHCAISQRSCCCLLLFIYMHSDRFDSHSKKFTVSHSFCSFAAIGAAKSDINSSL